MAEATQEMIALAREIVKQFYPEMPANYSGRRVKIAIAAIQATTRENQSMWRNGITNTVALTDRLRRKHEPSLRRSKAFAAFDADLDAALQSWFDVTRAAEPSSYSEAEQVWLAHLKEQSA